MYKGKFTYNGGEYTNKIHRDIYDKWTSQISLLVDEVKKYMMSDKENFDDRINDLVVKLNLDINKKISELSLGNLKKVGIF